jgi:hypothetical protein
MLSEQCEEYFDALTENFLLTRMIKEMIELGYWSL